MDIYNNIINSLGISKNTFYMIFEIIVVCIGWYFYKKAKSND